MTEEERSIYFDKKVEKTEKDVTEDINFWIIQGGIILGLILILCLIYLFCKMNRANKEIISEVEVLGNGPQGNKVDQVDNPDTGFTSPKKRFSKDLDGPDEKVYNRPAIDDTSADDMKGFKKATTALSAFGREKQ